MESALTAAAVEALVTSGDWAPVVGRVARHLVGHPSVNGSLGEVEFPHRMRELLAGLPYFREHPTDLWLEPCANDPSGRSNLFALVRGSGARGVILSGHYDVVGVADYGHLEEFAFDPDRLLVHLRQALRARAADAADRLALADLEGGDFLPGRGMLDMKSGLAVGVAVMAAFASRPRAGSLLLVASPDEEVMSAGFRSAIPVLGTVARERGVEFQAGGNLDAEVDGGSGETGQVAFLGSVGKLLVSVLLVGRATHAGAPFEGINAALMAALLTARLEGNAEIVPAALRGDGAVAPPTCLQMGDLKSGYDVTLPAMAWSTYNLLFTAGSPAELLSRVGAEAAAAMEAALALLAARADAAGAAFAGRGARPTVVTFGELLARAGRLGTDAAPEGALTDPVLASRAAVVALAGQVDLEPPAAVLCVSSLYYPPTALDSGHRALRLREAIARHAAAVAAETGYRIGVRPTFPGISDMSFLGSQETSATLGAVAAQTPLPGRFAWSPDAARSLDIPVVNIGPWGRDYHHRLERVHTPYSFQVLPELVYRVVSDIAGREDAAQSAS